MTKLHRYIVLLTVVPVAAACGDLTSPSFDDPNVEELTGGGATRAAIAAGAIGLIRGQRGMTNSFVSTLGIFGREAYNLRPEEPRTITNTLIDPLIGSSAFWSAQYRQLQNAFVLLRAVEAASTLSDEEKEAMRGFVKTFMAEAYFEVALLHDPLPIPLDVDRAPSDELAPLEPVDAAYALTFQLFDEGAGHLAATGAAFPFEMPPGFADFASPAAFRTVNRALKARALKYRGEWADVLTTLAESFIDPAGSFASGAYFDYSTQSGDDSNTMFAQRGTNLFAHPRLLADARPRTGGGVDLRAEEKLSGVEAFTLLGITVTEQFDVYMSLSDPIPWIQNEELILIRAEAHLGLDDRASAIADINTVRVGAGGLDPLPDGFGGDLLGELLYDKRYSLMWEGGFTYLDARQYDRMGNTPSELPRAAPNHVVYPRYPYPNNECIARGIEDDEGCQPVLGF